MNLFVAELGGLCSGSADRALSITAFWERRVAMHARVALTVLTLLHLGTAVHAQPGLVRFDFEGPTLQVHVQTGGAAGSAEVVDGAGPGVLVADRDGGGTAMSLADGVLSLENLSGSPVDYLIAVPQTTNIALSIDGRTVLAVAAAGGGRQVTWRWGGREAAGAGATSAASVAVGRGSRYGGDATRGSERSPARVQPPRRLRTLRINAYVGDLVADSIDVVEHTRMRGLKIILGGERLVVSGDRSVRFRWWEEQRWGMIVPRADGVEVTAELPSGLERYHIRVGGVVIWELRNGVGRAYCDPLAEIVRRDGRREWLFTFIDGQLNCRRTERPLPA